VSTTIYYLIQFNFYPAYPAI